METDIAVIKPLRSVAVSLTYLHSTQTQRLLNGDPITLAVITTLVIL
jgi:hypothetical protein